MEDNFAMVKERLDNYDKVVLDNENHLEFVIALKNLIRNTGRTSFVSVVEIEDLLHEHEL